MASPSAKFRIENKDKRFSAWRRYKMDTVNHIYNGKSWKASPTVSDKNSFFHAAFGKRVDGKGPYLDKLVKFRRSRWATFLSRFQNEAMPPLVADTLQKCFSANEKYKHVSVEYQDHFKGYILDIMSAVCDVTMEDILILATLENARVILFKAGESEPVVIVDPDTEVFASSQYIEEPKGDVVLHLEGNAFSRMNPVLDSVIKYEKGGTAGIEGVQFQVELLTVFLLNALQKLTDWQLSTENTAAGKFDDVIVEWQEGATLLQAKYRQKKKKKITLEELLATNSRNDNFSIPKYFLSYKNIKKTFKVREVIICTNASVDRKVMKFLKAQKVDPESLLHYDNCDCQFYTFNDNVLDQLMENVKSYCEENPRNVDVDISTITKTSIKEFLRHLQLFFNYPAGKVIERLMSCIKNLENFYVDVSHLDIYNKMLEWFRQEKGECITELYAKAIFLEINRDKHWQRLEKYKISFQCINSDFLISKNSKRLFHFIVEDGSLLQEINILQTLHSNGTKFLFVSPSDGTEKYKQVEAFHLPKYTILVLVWPKVTEEDTLHEVGCKLKEILDKFEYKKVVLIADLSNKIPQLSGLIQDNCKIINKPITLRDLSKDSQERILQEENIIFQGSHVSLKEVLAVQANEDYAKFLNTEELEKLVRGEMINVGTPVLELDEHIKQFYIKRKFKKEKTKEIFPEELICEMREKVVLICDSAGTGKSTVLTNLAVTTKKKYPHLWVIRINLNDHTQILKEFLRKNRKSINILELLDSKDATKLTNQLERSLFSMNAKVVLMLDGFDEISPDYTQLVLSLLSHSQEQQNFAKVIITTRQHMARELEEKLQVESFVLVPFVKQNQIDFLVSYWMRHLKPDNNQRAKCENYAKAALARINKMSSRVRLFEKGSNHFTALPLHVRMIAEIFEENNQFEKSDKWEGCREYLVGDGIEPKLPEKMNVTRLYKMFIEKKRNVFVDKENPSGNTAVNLALKNMFEECQAYHKNLAIELILDKTKCKLFSCHRQTARNLEINVLKIGIVQKIDNIYQFAHRTYAEYFVAESLIEELQLPNENIEFQNFLIEEILLKAPIDTIHDFFNSFLQEMIDKLSSNTFCKYQCVSYKITSFDALKFQLINDIVKFGHLAIFQLILKCVDINFFTKKLKVPMQFFETSVGESIPEYSNILNILQQEAYVGSIFNPITFLGYAAKSGNLETVKFLVEQGANVNIGKYKPLRAAVESGNFEVLKFLVEKGADVNAKLLYSALYRTWHPKDTTAQWQRQLLVNHGTNVNFPEKYDTTVLHIAVKENNFRLAELLMNHGANVDFADQYGTTALHVAVKENHFHLAEFLVNRGANVDFANQYGTTALHIAVKENNFHLAELLVNRGANVDFADRNGTTALHIAVKENNFHLAELLMNRGTNVNFAEQYDTTVPHIAVKENHFPLAELLMNRGANVDFADRNGTIALHVAVEENHFHLAELLVNRGANVDFADRNGTTALPIALTENNFRLAELLVNHGANVNLEDMEGNTALHLAAKRLLGNIMKFLIKHDANVNSKNKADCTALYLSIEKYCTEENECPNIKNLDLIKFLIESGGDVDIKYADGSTVLHLAAKAGNLDIVNLLMEFGIDADIMDNIGQTALHVAALRNHTHIVKFLIQHSADSNIRDIGGQTVLHSSIDLCNYIRDNDRCDVLKLIIEKAADINLKDNHGSTALHLATTGGDIDAVNLLVKLGADVNISDAMGATGLHLAALKGFSDIVQCLVKSGADVNSRNSKGCTPLHLVAEVDAFDNVVLINTETIDGSIKHSTADQDKLDVLRGAEGTEINVWDIDNIHLDAEFSEDNNEAADIKDDSGDTVLHLAVRKDYLEVVEVLLKHKADINIKDNNGLSALQIAVYYRRLDIAKSLVKHGANINDLPAAVLLAAKTGDLDSVVFCVEIGVDVNVTDDEGYTALQLALNGGHLKIVEYLVEMGADLTGSKNYEPSVLCLAAKSGDSDFMTSLLESCTGINVTDEDGNTALHLAVRNDRLDVVVFLMNVGIDLNVKNNDGRTALHVAADRDRLRIANFLVEQGAHLNLADNWGSTALHLAACCNLDFVKFLVERGADIHLEDSNGDTAGIVAKKKGHIAAFKYLQKELSLKNRLFC